MKLALSMVACPPVLAMRTVTEPEALTPSAVKWCTVASAPLPVPNASDVVQETPASLTVRLSPRAELPVNALRTSMAKSLRPVQSVVWQYDVLFWKTTPSPLIE